MIVLLCLYEFENASISSIGTARAVLPFLEGWQMLDLQH